MKILILANNDFGLLKFRRELIEKLIEEQHKVIISLPKGNYISDLKKIGCDYIETDISRHGTNPFQDLKLLKNYKSVLRKVNPDIVFTYTIKPNI